SAAPRPWAAFSSTGSLPHRRRREPPRAEVPALPPPPRAPAPRRAQGAPAAAVNRRGRKCELPETNSYWTDGHSRRRCYVKKRLTLLSCALLGGSGVLAALALAGSSATPMEFSAKLNSKQEVPSPRGEPI